MVLLERDGEQIQVWLIQNTYKLEYSTSDLRTYLTNNSQLLKDHQVFLSHLQMNYLKSFFTSTPQEQARSQVQKYLSSIQLTAKHQALALTFQYQLNNSIAQCSFPSLYIKQMASKLSTTRNVSSIVKLFTILHNLVYERDYPKEELQGMEDIPQPMIQNEEERTWFNEFATNYCNYLRKLPSVSDVYSRAKIGKLEEQNKSTFLIQVFRMINQISTLFPSICTVTNTIGRYYLTSYPEIPQFYRMLNKEILMIYSYLKTIIDEILSNYRLLDVGQLRMFVKTIPEIQLTCDKMEDLLLNKYFKGKSIKAKIYFKEEKVQEICYYLDYQLQGKHFLQEEDEVVDQQTVPKE